MSNTTDAEVGREIDEQMIAIRINRLWGKMPYGGICHFRYAERNSTPFEALGIVEHNLIQLVDVLAGVARTDERRRAELDEIKCDFAAIGRTLKRITEAT